MSVHADTTVFFLSNILPPMMHFEDIFLYEESKQSNMEKNL